MFAILLSDSMDPFYRNVAAFPTLLWTILLALCVLYWLGAVLGIVDLDVFDASVGDVDINAHSDAGSSDVLAGLLLRFGLVGVPIPVSLSLFALFGWLISYYAVHVLFAPIPPGPLRWLAGVPLLVATVFPAAWIAARLIRPLRPLFRNATAESAKHLLGQVAIVRTSRVDESFGEATMADGGAGLVLRVRAAPGNDFGVGSRVVLYERIDDGTTYRVISEREFEGR